MASVNVAKEAAQQLYPKQKQNGTGRLTISINYNNNAP